VGSRIWNSFLSGAARSVERGRFWWGERFYSNETFNDRCHCEQRHMHFEFPLMCSPMLSRVRGMACCSGWGNKCVVGRNGGPLRGLWCVTEAKNDQQKTKHCLWTHDCQKAFCWKFVQLHIRKIKQMYDNLARLVSCA